MIPNSREAFDQMDEKSQGVAKQVLVTNRLFDSEESEETIDDHLWQGIEEDAREDWNSFPYFIVLERSREANRYLFACPDWPTAERVTKLQLSAFSAGI